MNLMLGIDLGGTKAEAVLLAAAAAADEGRPGAAPGSGGAGEVRWRERVPTPAGDYAATLAMLVGLVQRGRAAASAAAASADAATTAEQAARISIGIGTPGTVTADGRMKNCNSQCLNGRFLQRDLEAALGQPVAVANDANCLALSEATDGAGAGHGVVFAAILGTGVGAGIAVHGRVLTGPNGVAGEWGHNPLPWAEPGHDPQWRCYCGQVGCVETLASGPGLARDHREFARNGGSGAALGAEEIAAAAARGDAASAATLERHASRLARALAGVINVLDPDIIVLGGGLSRMPHLVERVPQLWQRWVVSGGVREPVRTRLTTSLHGDASGVRGAAWLGRALLQPPPG
ncbi:MAG: ROK family protein [Rubrivivax sp.]|nr:ROK family protein [Rubrivivax sp.]